MTKKYPLFDIYWDERDIENVVNVIKRGSYWATGPEIQEFEQELQRYLNIDYAITFNSGTSALHAVLLAYGITSGEVIIPSMSFISTANCVVLAGAKPVFADIEKETLGLDSEDVKNKITSNTKAIIPMHYGGKVCKNIENLKEIADNHKLLLIEDNAESFGATINKKYAGTIGHAGMFSFCQNKIITTGEGGAICTNNKEIDRKLRLIRSHGRVEKNNVDYFSNINESEYIDIGYNYRIPSMNAALGISQLEKVERIIKLRREVAGFYEEILKDSHDVEVIPELDGQRTVYQLYSILLKKSEKRNDLQKHLLKNQIYSKVYFHPIHLKPYYCKNYNYKKGDLPITENISKKILTLPISVKFTKIDQLSIINEIEKFFES
jgi:perosamine synthetase